MRQFPLFLLKSLLIIIIINSFAGCSERGDEKSLAELTESEPGIQWYILDRGKLRPSGIPERNRKEKIPWTLQERITSFLQVDDRIILGINGHGILSLDGTIGGLMDAKEYYSSKLKGKTLGRFFYIDGTIYGHVYKDSILSDSEAASDPFLFIILREGRLKAVSFPLQTQDGPWEAVDVHAVGNEWLIAWKRSRTNRTDFQYNRHSLSGEIDESINRETFFSSYKFEDISTGQFPIKHFLSDVQDENEPVYQLILSAPETREEARFLLGDLKELEKGETGLCVIQMVKVNNRISALLPEGRLIFWEGREENPFEGLRPESIRPYDLPRLPSDFVYTGLWITENTVLVSWEEKDFTLTGQAGLLVYPLLYP